MKKLILVTLTILAVAAAINSILFVGSYFDLVIARDYIVFHYDNTTSHSSSGWIIFLASFIVSLSWFKIFWRKKYMRGFMVIIDLSIKFCGGGMRCAARNYRWYENGKYCLMNLKRKFVAADR
jgi:hypothetical protein